MKNAVPLLLAILFGGAAGALSSSFLSSSSEASQPTEENTELLEEIQRLNQSVSSLLDRQKDLEAQLSETRLDAPTPAAARTQAVPVQAQVEELVANYLEEQGIVTSTPSDDLLAGGPDSSSGVKTAPLADIMEMLTDDDVDGWAQDELWEEIRRAGRIDEVLEEYERLAEMHPNNPDVQTDLGSAYIQKIFDVGAGPLAGKYGTLADEAYDRALEADPEHWSARFSKALSLSNWPEFMGKTGEAINQFEILVSQQEQQPAQSKFAQTYFILGNMHQRKGDTEAAMEVWRRGLAQFPDNEMLREQIRNNE